MRFFSIIKPGIIFGNAVTLCGGYFLGSQNNFHFLPFLFALIGMSLVIAAGCVLNNCIDRDIDRLMERTKNRPLVTGAISLKTAILYAIALGIVGFAILSLTNILTVIIALIGIFFYVVVYSLYFKRNSKYGVAVGGISGAVPPVIGYCAATNRFDLGAIILFLILFFWQIPHFYAIAIYRLQDFKAASIPVLPLRKGIAYTKKHMLVFTVIFAIVSLLPTLCGYIGLPYFILALILGLYWIYLAWRGLKANNDIAWSRRMFLFSIINITILSFMMAT